MRLRVALFGVCGLLLLLGGGAVAAATYDAAHRDELLPGVVVGGADAGGRPVASVVRGLDDRLPAIASTPVRIAAGGEEVRVTLDQLGLRSNAREVVARARADAEGIGTAKRVWHRLLGRPVDLRYDVRLEVDRAAVEREVGRLAAAVAVAPVDAGLDASSGMVSFLPAREGRAIDVAAATEQAYDLAVRVANGVGPAQVAEVRPAVEVLEPKVKGFDDVILIRTAENKLYHYEGGAVVKEYRVATGTRRYPTPKGRFSVVLKRRNPTWVNPDPRGWGRSLPARIGPGPRNPLGTRALNLDAPAIRIHGTSNVASLGTNASHGCIRMAMADVEELFDRVEEGTPVVIVEGPPPPPGLAPGPAVPETPVTTIGDPEAPVDLEAG
ncbi:MAG: L,D-transpeptidase family protein [Acidimicrobiia bacterium]